MALRSALARASATGLLRGSAPWPCCLRHCRPARLGNSVIRYPGPFSRTLMHTCGSSALQMYLARANASLRRLMFGTEKHSLAPSEQRGAASSSVWSCLLYTSDAADEEDS